MNKPNFTPGPWHVGRGHELVTGMSGWKYYPVCWSKDDENVCDIVYNKADADLIAAAPEMYKILDELLGSLKFHHPDMHYSISQIESVLRKARGESEVFE